MDTSGDGVIDEGEFTNVCSQFGATGEEAAAAFAQFGAEAPVTRYLLFHFLCLLKFSYLASLSCIVGLIGQLRLRCFTTAK